MSVRNARFVIGWLFLGIALALLLPADTSKPEPKPTAEPKKRNVTDMTKRSDWK